MGWWLAVLVLAGAAALTVSGCGTPARRPNVLLVSIDTVRADHCSAWGYRRRTTPNIDALAARGVRYEMAISQASWTLPAMASVHTGLYPWEHGATSHDRPLDGRFETLAEQLQAAGYATWAVVSTAFVSPRFGLGQGFDVVDESVVLGHRGVSSPGLTDRAVGLLRSRTERPFFLWVHYFDPHYSYQRHPEYGFVTGYTGKLDGCIDAEVLWEHLDKLTEEDRRYVADTYDEELAFTDHWIGRLLEALAELGLERSTIVVVVGDHGEEFFERGHFGHGRFVYQELVHVPLAIVDPRRRDLRGRVVRVPVETRSVYRTVLEACGIHVGESRGEDLLAVAGIPGLAGVALSEGTDAWRKVPRLVSIVAGRWKLTLRETDRAVTLYDLRADPGETRDLAHDPATATTVAKLLARLERDTKPGVPAPVRTPDPETLRQLRSLGYVQ